MKALRFSAGASGSSASAAKSGRFGERRLATQRFEPAFVQRTVRLLRLADQVKFAQRPAGQEEATARIAEARELAGAIENRLAPAPAPSPAAPAVPPVPPVETAPGAVGSPAAGAGGAA